LGTWGKKEINETLKNYRGVNNGHRCRREVTTLGWQRVLEKKEDQEKGKLEL